MSETAKSAPVTMSIMKAVLQGFSEMIKERLSLDRKENEQKQAQILELLEGLDRRCAELEAREPMEYLGTFDAAKTYRRNACVTWGGSIWACKVASTSEKPEPGCQDWQLACKKGRDGKDGKDWDAR
ncbi:hypothetical protein [Variovorax rhizosphaerae]|uniref:Uncharacterized protein n=1 Tax=Variovorax rhizosphaerae TaxID=1836200 RepID=A0ABU8WFU8_9BURK